MKVLKFLQENQTSNTLCLLRHIKSTPHLIIVITDDFICIIF